jgi:hypothetical protein
MSPERLDLVDRSTDVRRNTSQQSVGGRATEQPNRAVAEG